MTHLVSAAFPFDSVPVDSYKELSSFGTLQSKEVITPSSSTQALVTDKTNYLGIFSTIQ